MDLFNKHNKHTKSLFLNLFSRQLWNCWQLYLNNWPFLLLNKINKTATKNKQLDFNHKDSIYFSYIYEKMNRRKQWIIEKFWSYTYRFNSMWKFSFLFQIKYYTPYILIHRLCLCFYICKGESLGK